MKSILRLAAVVLLSIKPVHGGKKYCEKKGSTEADCLALKASKKCVWADEACVKGGKGGGGKKGGKKSYCEKKGPTEADCLALPAGKCVWADEACVKDPDAEDKKSCKGMKGKEKKKCKKKCKGKKGKAKKKCKGKDSK